MPSYKNRYHKISYNVVNSSSSNLNDILLLLHDNGQSSRIFDSELKYFSGYFKTITADLAGHGQSPDGTGASDNFWIDHAVTLCELLDKIKVKRTAVIGIGGGALVALNMAMINPGSVSSILAESIPGHEPDQEYLNSLVSYREKIKNTDLRSRYQSLNGSKWERILDEDTEMQKRFLDSGHSYFINELSKVNCPVLFAGCEPHEFVPQMEERTKTMIPMLRKSQVHMYRPASYPLFLSRNDEFRSMSLYFLMD
ncbi:MAG: alpha/beta hydrolase [Spirochaetes bacterium]|nr:alpha/beta hydrolase [Spirochaetota bacterium]